MKELVFRIPPAGTEAAPRENLLAREWLVTNGLGGYAAGTIGGVAMRRYHGLLTAALPAPFGRQMMLNHVTECLRLPDGTMVHFGGSPRIGGEPRPRRRPFAGVRASGGPAGAAL